MENHSVFQPFEKIARLSRECVITEKIDGTNAQIMIELIANWPDWETSGVPLIAIDDSVMAVGSRNQWISPEKDNYGFARWAHANAFSLMSTLGPGRHYGEWWGSGCQRGYGLTKGEKRFSLFNTGRWTPENAPSCCHVVPVLYKGDFSTEAIDATLEDLRTSGSKAAPGFMDPEGIVIYHVASRSLFKKTLDDDAIPKSLKDKLRAEQYESSLK